MKKFLFPVLWVMMVALVMSSCAKSAYKKAIPADAAVVMELDIKSVAKKADLLGQKDAITQLIKSLAETEEDQQIAGVVANPMDWGIDVFSPIYVFSDATLENGFVLASVADKEDIINVLKQASDNTISTQDDGDYTWINSPDGMVLGVVTGKALLVGSGQDKAAYRKLLEQGKDDSFFASEAGKMMEKNSGDATVMLNMASLSDEVKAKAVRELTSGRGRNIPGIEEAAKNLMETKMVLNLLCEKGKISLNLIADGIEEQTEQVLIDKIDPGTLEQLPAEQLVAVVALSMEGKAYWEAASEALETLAMTMGEQGEKMLNAIGQYVQAMDGTLAVSMGGKDWQYDPQLVILMPAPKSEFDQALNAIGAPMPKQAVIGGDDHMTSVSSMPYTYGAVSAGFDKADNAKNAYLYAYLNGAPIRQMALKEMEYDLRNAPAEIANQINGLVGLADFAELKMEEKNAVSLTLWLTDESDNALAILLSRCIALGQSYTSAMHAE